MKNIINFFLVTIIFLFFLNIINYYLSEKNIKETNLNRININEILKKKSLNLPVIKSDTDNVIEFNTTYSEEIKNDKTRSFWNLLEIK
ncbi:hypothetical protein OA498_03525 [Candidatus Pelagibacter bacterium]|nr:hypothetical protein [Candidatus Pelagibacter bacterium]